MATVIGIDTGGTFTDGVIVDLDTKEILAAVKSPTTHQDLMIGIRKTIHKLSDYELKSAAYIGISTTLATNAIVENRGCRVGLLMLGHEPERELPQCEYRILPGRFSIRGEELEPLDLEKTKEAIESLRDQVDAVAASGICSVRNQKHENTVKKMVQEILGVPVVSAHELSSVLGIHERTVTCVLNARLVFVIDNLLRAVKQVLREVGLGNIPIMVVKGDGSLMNETITRERPIETILSGPAASIIGATYLHGSSDGLVLDMGGTTTDIAILKNGLPRLDKEGAKVGGWRTRVAAAEVTTAGLGGDSRIYPERWGLKVGPRRSWPVSIIAKDYPTYREELEVAKYHAVGFLQNEVYEGYFLLHEAPPHMELNETQRRIIEAVKDGPHTLGEISRRVDMPVELFTAEKLVDHGILGMVGFTPTDILCLEESYPYGDREAAGIAAGILSDKLHISVDELLRRGKESINERMCRVILDSALTYEKVDIDPFGDDYATNYFLMSAIQEKKDSIFHNCFHLHMPIIGIGAPTKFWLPPAAEKFHAEAVFPEYNYAANAVGAAVGKVMSLYHIVVQNFETSAAIFAPWGKTDFKNGANPGDNLMSRAIECGLEQAKKRIAEDMKRQNVGEYDILIDRKDSCCKGKGTKTEPMETILDISVVGHMDSIKPTEPKGKSLLGAFWGKDKSPDYSKIPSVT